MAGGLLDTAARLWNAGSTTKPAVATPLTPSPVQPQPGQIAPPAGNTIQLKRLYDRYALEANLAGQPILPIEQWVAQMQQPKGLLSQ
jgi:hypothetical protein